MKVIILLLPQAYEPKLLVEVRGSKYAQNDYARALKTVSDILPFFLGCCNTAPRQQHYAEDDQIRRQPFRQLNSVLWLESKSL